MYFLNKSSLFVHLYSEKNFKLKNKNMKLILLIWIFFLFDQIFSGLIIGDLKLINYDSPEDIKRLNNELIVLAVGNFKNFLILKLIIN